VQTLAIERSNRFGTELLIRRSCCPPTTTACGTNHSGITPAIRRGFGHLLLCIYRNTITHNWRGLHSTIQLFRITSKGTAQVAEQRPRCAQSFDAQLSIRSRKGGVAGSAHTYLICEVGLCSIIASWAQEADSVRSTRAIVGGQRRPALHHDSNTTIHYFLSFGPFSRSKLQSCPQAKSCAPILRAVQASEVSSVLPPASRPC
jgi:hypothetical protein